MSSATVYVELYGSSLSAATKSIYAVNHETLFTPPASVSGKLCEMHVTQLLMFGADAATFPSCPIRIEASFTQPQSGLMVSAGINSTSAPTTTSTTPTYDPTNNVNQYNTTTLRQNKIVAFAYYNTVVIHDRPVLVQLSDGPQVIKWTLTCAGNVAFNQTGTGPYTGNSPSIVAILNFVPVNVKRHHEELESFSSGPFVRF